MKKIIILILFGLFLIPAIKSDGIPYPYIRDQIREEHQIVLVELKDNQVQTTLDLGIKNRPSTVFTVSDDSIYISSSNPFWLKTFSLPSEFKVKDFCINSYSFSNTWFDKSPIKVTINGNVVYLYTPVSCTSDYQCAKACSYLCPSYSSNCCVNGNTGRCNYATGECYCERNSNRCTNCPACDYTYEYCSGYGTSKYCTRSYEKMPTGQAVEIMSRPENKDQYCRFMLNQNLTSPQFVNVSSYFKPGEYNTVEIRSNSDYQSFSINKMYLASETKELVKIIIPFKTMPKSVEIGGYGLYTWTLDQPFTKQKREWYGYYGGQLLSEKQAPLLAGTAQSVENIVKSEVTQTQVATDVTGGFQGKVSDLLTVSTSGVSHESSPTIKLAGEDIESVYQAYIQDNAYVIELKILPYELKRMTIKWVEDLNDVNQFQYYYPLGTGRTWLDNISYTAIYVKLPENYILTSSNIAGKEDVKDASYNYYRWKFVESTPTQDLIVNVKKVSEVETFFLSTYVPIIGLVIFVLVFLILSRLGPIKKGF